MRGGARPRVESQGVGVGGIEIDDVPAFPAALEETPEAPAVIADDDAPPDDDDAPLICPVHAPAATATSRTTLPTPRFEAISWVVTTPSENCSPRGLWVSRRVQADDPRRKNAARLGFSDLLEDRPLPRRRLPRRQRHYQNAQVSGEHTRCVPLSVQTIALLVAGQSESDSHLSVGVWHANVSAIQPGEES